MCGWYKCIVVAKSIRYFVLLNFSYKSGSIFNKLKKLKSRSRSMVVWVMVRNGCVCDGVVDGVAGCGMHDGVVDGVVGCGMDCGVDDGFW